MASLTLAAWGFSAALAEEQSQLERCWTQEALAHTDKELGPSRGVRFDLAALKQETLDPAVPVAPGLRGSIRSVELPAGAKLIALTFDLCESGVSVAGYNGRIIDLLRNKGHLLRLRQMARNASRTCATAHRG